MMTFCHSPPFPSSWLPFLDQFFQRLHDADIHRLKKDFTLPIGLLLQGNHIEDAAVDHVFESWIFFSNKLSPIACCTPIRLLMCLSICPKVIFSQLTFFDWLTETELEK